jgi:hypothetical protein
MDKPTQDAVNQEVRGILEQVRNNQESPDVDKAVVQITEVLYGGDFSNLDIMHILAGAGLAFAESVAEHTNSSATAYAIPLVITNLTIVGLSIPDKLNMN